MAGWPAYGWALQGPGRPLRNAHWGEILVRKDMVAARQGGLH
jgi:hypothetical protein